MNKNITLKMIPEEQITVTGSEFSIEDRTTGRVFITSKPYINKLFDQMGYRGLNVIKILEEFAGKYISDVGSLRDSKIYIDEITDTFLVANPLAIERLSEFYDELESRGFKITKVTKYDNYWYWDQIELTSPKGISFVLYINLSGEYINLKSLHYDSANILDGLINEGDFYLKADDFINSIFVTLESPIRADADYTPTKKISIREYLDVMSTLGYIKKGRKSYYLTDEGQAYQGIVGDIVGEIEEANLKSWIERLITPTLEELTFKDMFDLITQNLDHVMFSQISDFYISNAKETSDLFLCNK